MSLLSSDNYKITSTPKTRFCVCGGKSKSFKFALKPEKLGKLDVTVQAITISGDTTTCSVNEVLSSTTTAAADALTKKLLVEPEGIKKEFSTSTFFCPADFNGTYSGKLEVDLPKKIVRGSVHSVFSVVGDLMGPTMDGLDKLLAMPCGCGEQNMILFAPNIYVMDYLKATNQLTAKIESKAIGFMKTGYQRELTYRHRDGAYSAFGTGVGSTWLTAFVLRSYAQARKYIYIDPAEIALTKKYLLGLQDSKGCFKDLGMLHHQEMKGGVTSGITMTAFVLTALLEADTPPSDSRIQRAVGCISLGLDDVNDPYTGSVLAFSLGLAGSPQQTKMLHYLKQNAVETDGLTHWQTTQKQPTNKKKSFLTYHKPRSADIEMTSYALMSYIQGSMFGDRLEHLSIVRWLAKQRNSYGGFSSTQDTCVGLQALSQYATKTLSGDYSVIVDAQASNGFNKQLMVTNDNKLLLQRVVLDEAPNNISITATGKGCALAQISIKYNIPEKIDAPSFKLHHNITDEQMITCKHTLTVCGSYLHAGKSNMALIRVNMVSGFEPDETELLMLPQLTNVGLERVEFDDGVVTFYVEEFGNQSKCISFGISQMAEVDERKPATITILDYYEPDNQETTSYKVGECPEINIVS